jgi:hypothetical protein
MSDNKLYSTYAGKKGGDFEGRTFARISGYMATARDALKEAGAEIKGQGSYLLPAGKEDAIVAQLETLTVADQAQALKDRAPVEASKAKDLKIGDDFDFGGDTGKAAIVGIGGAFTSKGESVHDDRLKADQETVYVYNANAPKSAMPKVEKTAEEKAEAAAARAAATAERDQSRVPVAVGSVEEGANVTVGDAEVSVQKLGSAWELKDQGAVDALKERFPDSEFEVGANVQFASFEAPEAANEPGM